MVCQSASSAASMHNCFLRIMSQPRSHCDHVLTALLTQMGWPDMRLPILYTMSWPERVPCSEQTWPRLDFRKCSELTFKEPDHAKYPSMKLAYAAGRCECDLCHPLSHFVPCMCGLDLHKKSMQALSIPPYSLSTLPPAAHVLYSPV